MHKDNIQAIVVLDEAKWQFTQHLINNQLVLKVVTSKSNKVTAQQIRSWIHRQRTLGTPSKAYVEWLRKQYKITCDAEVIKGDKNETR
jgi:hypothetical protein